MNKRAINLWLKKNLPFYARVVKMGPRFGDRVIISADINGGIVNLHQPELAERIRQGIGATRAIVDANPYSPNTMTFRFQ
jgi:hypothetical protein